MLQLNLKILALFLKIETELNVGGGGEVRWGSANPLAVFIARF